MGFMYFSYLKCQKRLLQSIKWELIKMIPWLIGYLETSQKREFFHKRMFFSEMGTKKKIVMLYVSGMFM